MRQYYTYYAVCHANGPISHRIHARNVEDAVATVDRGHQLEWGGGPDVDAEDDLGIVGGEGMTESQFAAALESRGLRAIRDLETVEMNGRVVNVLGGWRLWARLSEPEADR